MSASIWTTLGIDPTNDPDEVRRAYARRLKQVHPEDDPDAFQALRAAYDHAAHMARNGWAVPQPSPPGAETGDDAAWADEPDIRWTPMDEAPASAGWAPPQGDRWSRPDPAARSAAESALPDDIRAELARERDVAEAHQALCDALSAMVANPDGDRHEALSAMIRLFRSPGMESLTTFARTEQWLAHVVAGGGPVVDDLIEPSIQFFGWDSRRVGVDLRHAEPVLRRREAGVVLSRLERGDDPDHAVWAALKRPRTRRNRVSDRLTPQFAARVGALLQRIEYEFPELLGRLNQETVAVWQARLARPVLGPIFLWFLLLAPPVLAFFVSTSDEIEPLPGGFLAVWALTAAALFGLGVVGLHAVTRPRLAWRAGDPWRRPLWIRFGWAPTALLLPVAFAALPPPASWLPLLVLPLAAGLWVWARITTAHIPLPYGVRRDWSRYVGLVPIFAYVWLQGDVLGEAGLALQVAVLAAALVLQTGSEAIADEVAHQGAAARRRVAAIQLGTVAAVAIAVFASAAYGMGMAAMCGLVTAVALADRALVWNRDGALIVPRRFVLLLGWIAGFVVAAFLPFPDFARQMFAGLSLWLLVAAALTADAWLDGFILPERFRRRKNRRTPGELA